MGEVLSRIKESKLFAYFGVDFNPAYLGLAFAFGWIFSIQRIIPNKVDGFFNITLFLSTAAACLLLFGASYLLKRNLSPNRIMVILFPLLSGIAVLLLMLPSSYQHNDIFVLGLGAFCGVSIGWLYLLWGTFYSKLDIKQTIAILFGSVIVASLVKVIISFSASELQGIIICALLPALSVFCWHRAQKNLPASSDGSKRFSSKTINTLKTLAFGVIVFSFAIGVMRSLDLSYFSQPVMFDAFSHVIEIVVCIGIIVVTYRRQEDLDFSSMWFFVLLVIATGLVVGEYTTGALSSISFAILSAAQMLALVFVYLALADISHNSTFGSDVIFGAGWALYALPIGLGSLYSKLLGTGINSLRLALAVLYILFIAVFLFMRERSPHELRLFGDLNPPLTIDRMNLLNEQVGALAKKYGLSAREEEVIILYAQGRNRSFIGAHLFISENTVRDHIKKVYKKMHIHSKQELIDAIERAR